MKQLNGSWLSMLGFFAVTTLALSLVFAALLAGVTVALAGGEPAQIPLDQQVDPAVPGQTFSGVISDAHCRSRHMDSKQSASECARMCVRDGSTYAILDGDKSYELAGNPRQFDPFAGQRVTLIGTLSGDTIKVSSITPQTAGNKPGSTIQ